MQAKWAILLSGLAFSAAPLAAAEPAEVTIEVGKDQITFLAGKELVGRYHIAPTVAKPYLWPVNAPGNIPVTRAWPMLTGQPGETTDHVHQKSLWFCHGDVIPEGLELKDKVKGVDGVDFWSEAKGAGKIVCVDVGKPTLAKNRGSVATKNEWRAADGTKIMDEARIITLIDLGDARLLIFHIDLHASVCPITFGDTKEGSFGVRINDVMKEAKGNGKLTNADGKTTEKEIWGQKSPWCDYSGSVDGKPVGLTIFDDPANPVAAAWHSRGYGLSAANPFGREKSFPGQKGNTTLVKLAKGDHLKLRYGVLVHAGDAKAGKVAEVFGQFGKMKD